MSEDHIPGRGKAIMWVVLAGLAAMAAVALLMLALLDPWSEEQLPRAEDASVAADATADGDEGLPGDATVDAGKRVWRGRRITPSELRSLQRRNRSMINYCYDRAARRAPALVRKKTAVTVHLKKGGRVSRVDARAGGDAQLEGCLRRVIRAWRFPRALRAQKVEFSVVFAR